MKSTVENLSPTRVRLAVEVPFTEIEDNVAEAYKKIGSQLRVPGFRPGKIPARIIDQRIGRGAVLQEAVNDALPRVYTEAAREHELRPLGQPDIDVTNLDDGNSLSFTAEVDVRPEITLPNLDGLEVTVDDSAVTDTDVDEQLQALRERFGSLTGVERAVENGDYVSIDLAASVDGEPVEDGTSKGLSYEVGRDDLIPGLDAAITGTSARDTAVFQTELQQGEKAGANASITVTVNSVKEKQLPELDDEFAQMASEFDTVGELREDLRTRLGRAKALEQGGQARDRVLEKLLELVEFPVPESAVQGEVESREHDIVHSLGHDDALFERYLAMQGQTREEFTAELREGAEKSVRAQFILDAVADQQDVQVGDAELTEYIVRQAARYQMAPQEFANQVVQGGSLPALVGDVRRSKALAQVMEAAVVSDAAGNRIDLSALAAPDEVDEAGFGRDEDQGQAPAAAGTDAEPDPSA